MDIEIIKKSVKNLTLRIYPDGKIKLTAPIRTRDEYIKYFLEKKQPWIEKKLKELKARKIEQISYTTGEQLFFLGKKYNFILKESKKDFVVKDNFSITLYTKFPDDYEAKNKIINGWYRGEAEKIFVPILEKYLKLTGKKIEKLTIKTLKRNWGSCNYKKRHINLNAEMLKKDIKFIEYVILHEIAHLEHPDHSINFYSYIEKFMPDWKERKKL